MKKKFLSVLFALVLVLSFSLVTAVPAGAGPGTLNVIPFELGTKNDAEATAGWSSANPYDGSSSVHLVTGPKETEPSWGDGDEGRIVIDAADVDIATLGDIDTISWYEYLEEGYPPHVDIILDMGGGETDGLVIEYAYNTGTHVADTDNWYQTFNDGGNGPAEIDNTANAWLSSGEPGPLGGEAVSVVNYADVSGQFIYGTLAEWKDGTEVTEITSSTPVLRLEIEVDNWIVVSEAYIDDITINGVTYYGSIQDAIDVASPYDTIIVAEGTYAEYLHITTDHLTIEGVGIDQSIIDLDGLIPYWHYPGNKSFSSRAGVLITGKGSPDEIIEGVTFSGFTVQNAGLNPPITATGTHDGLDDALTLTDSTASWETDALVGQWVHNVSDKLIEIDISGNNPIRSYGLITANDATTVTATLAGGLEDDWDVGDTYEILPYEEYVDVAEDLQDDVPGIAISNGKDVSILYCKVINSGSVGISAGKARLTTLKQSEGVTIDHCIVSDHPSRGISVGHYVGPITITNNDCSNNGSPHPTDPSREYMGTGISVNGKSSSLVVSGGVISGNECHDNRYHGITLTGRVNGITVQDNIVTGSNFDEDGAGIFAEGGWGHPERCYDIIIRDNTVTGNIRGIIVYNAQNCTVGGDTAADGNTVTTDSGAFDSGQAAIKLDNAYNTVVKNNTVSCDGVGIRVTSCNPNTLSYGNTIISNTITGAKFAGVRITKGAYNNTFQYNTITGTTSLTIGFQLPEEETQGDGVFIDDDAGTGNVFHFNNIYDNEGDGMENQTATQVNATLNWWGGDISGPYHATTNPSGTGDKVVGNVLYFPWLIEPVVPGEEPTTFDETLALNTGWTLISVDKAVASAAWTATLTLKYTPTGGFVEAFPSDLGPLTAIYIKTVGGGGIGFNYAEVGPGVVYSKNLEAGWNLIGIPSTVANTDDILSPLRYVTAGTQQVVGLTTLVSQGEYNLSEESFYLATLTDDDWGDLPTLEPFDGYWANMEAADTFEVIPVP